MKIIYGGHWDEVPEEWVSLPEDLQDITQPLLEADNSIETIFTEHVVEHVSLIDAISFMKESYRCLKPGGVFRIAMPMIDKMVGMKSDDLSKHYSDVQTKHYYLKEDATLKELGLEGIREEPIAFMMDSLFKGHNHKFIWTSALLVKVLLKVGFSDVYACAPGQWMFDQLACLERIIRGVDATTLQQTFHMDSYDPETLVVEAKK